MAQAYNKGCRLSRTLGRAERFAAGLPIFCKYHGEHTDWYEYKNTSQTYPYIRCKKCINRWARDYTQRNYLRQLAKWTHRRDPNSEVTEEFLKYRLEKQSHCCALTGVQFDDDNKPSVDRIDSAGRYTQDNIQLVLEEVNRMKSDLPLALFIERCVQVAAKAHYGREEDTN